MARTPDRRPGESDEEGIVLENRSSGDNPTVAGGIRYVAGAFKFKDAIGIFDPRFPPAGGSNSEVQFNNAGLLSGSSLFTFNTSVGTVSASSFFSRNFFETNGYLRFNRPTQAVPTLPVDSAFIYMSGSTNDLIFSHYDNSKSTISSVRLNWIESNLSTGLLHGGLLSTENGTTTFSITSGSGFIVNYNASIGADPDPVVTYVTWPNYISQSLPFSGSALITYVAIDSTGSILQQINPYSTTIDADVIPLGRILHQSGSVTNGSITTPNVAYGLTHWHDDFTRLWGPLKISGHVLSPSGSNLTIKKTGGVSYAVGRNYQVDPNNPNQVTDGETTVSKVFREHTSGSTYLIDTGVGNAGYTEIDPTKYNNNGTLTSIGGSTDWSIQRVFWFPNSVNKAFFVYYGENVYATQTDALNAISTESFTEGSNTVGAAIFVAYIVVQRNCTNLSNTSQAKIIQASISRGTSAGGAGSGGGGGGTTTPGGADTYVQFNDGGAFGGDAQFTYNKTTDTLTIGNVSIGDSGLLSTSGLTANIFNTNATTVNLAGAATTLNVGNVAGTNNFSGVVKAPQGFSGSLTKLTDGTSYLIAGAGISISSGSNGAITITNDGTVGDITAVNAGNGLTGGGTSGAVSLAIDNSVVATVSGTTFTGATKHNAGLSGSLTKLTDGTSYLIAGTNIGISTGSSGAVTISNTAPTFYQWNELSPAPRLNTTASVSIAGGLGASYAAQSVGSDVFFFVSGSIGTTAGISVFGGDLMVSGTLETQTITNFSTTSATAPLTINGSARGTNSSGRGVSIVASPGGGGVSGGNIVIDAGDGTGSSSSGGSVTIDAGSSTTVAAAGSVSISAGTTTSTGGTAQAGSVTIAGGNLPSGGPGTAGSISLTTGNAANVNAIPGNITLTAQRGKVILKPTTAAAPVGTDTFLYVSGTISDNDKSVFAGDVVISGSLRVFTGISGSLTSSNVTAGQVVVAGTGGVLSGSNNFVWDNSNIRVGIGTATASARIHTVGIGELVRIADNVSSNVRLSLGTTNSSGTVYGFIQTARDSDGVAGQNLVLQTTAGNVGIGGIRPTARLEVTGSTNDNTSVAFHVLNSSNSSIIYARNDSKVGIATSTLTEALNINGNTLVAGSGEVQFNNGSQRIYSSSGGLLIQAGGRLRFFTGGANERINIEDVQGLVGIGTNSQTSRLFVSGSSTASTPTMIVREGVASPTGGVATFDVQNSSGTSLLFVTGSGNVGIGSSNPGATLDVNAGANGRFRFAAGGTSAISDIDNFQFRSSNTFTTFMTLNGTGLGIGASPSARLFVSGGINASTPTMVVREGYASPLAGVGVFDVQNSAGTSILFVTGSGFVGIGTNNPTGKHHVYGVGGVNSILQTTSAAANLIVSLVNPGNTVNIWNRGDINQFLIDSSWETGIRTLATRDIYFSTNSTERVRILSGGTTAFTGSIEPGADNLYDLGSSSKRWRNLYANSISGSLTGSNVLAGQIVLAGTGGVLSGSYNIFQDLSTGNVGIGTSTSLTGKLNVVGDVYNTGYTLYSTLLVAPTLQNNGALGLNTNAASPIAFNTNNVERMRISAVGDVGIGTATYTARFFVSGSSTSTTPTVVIREGVASPTGGVGVLNVQNSSGTSLLFVSGSGNVGIGTVTTNEKLVIQGNIGLVGELRLRQVGTSYVTVANTSDVLQLGGQEVTGTPNVRVKLKANFVELDATNVGIGTTTTGDMLAVNGSVSVTGSILPGADNTYNLGSSSKRWAGVFASNISGSLTGSNVTAGQVVVAGTGGVLSGSNDLFWNNASGRLGIGTSTINDRLEVNGNVRFTRASVPSQYIQYFGDANQNTILGVSSGKTLNLIADSNSTELRLQTQGAWSVAFYTNSSERARIDASGNLGVGVTSVLARLHVSGSSTVSDQTALIRAGTPSQTGPVLEVEDYLGTTLLVVSGSGAIGVGTNNPAARFHAASSVSVPAYFESSGTNSVFLRLGNNVDTLGYIGYTQSNLVFYTSNSERVRIDSSGNVGIGTVTVSSRLIVSGSSTSSTPTMVVREGVASPTGGAATFDVQNVSGTSLLFVSGSGNVGIGTNNPAYKLEVRGGQTAVVSDTSPQFTIDTVSNSTDSALILRSRDGSGFSLRSQITQSSSTGALTINNDVGSNGTNRGIILQTAGNERVRIDSAGNVGIGTNNTNGNRLAISGGNLSITGSALPGPNAASNGYDLGSTTYRWRDLYARSGSFSGDVTIAGDLTVNGTQFIVNTQVVEIKDNAILLNAGPSPANTGGIYVADTTAGITGSLIWDTTTDQWKAGRLGSETTLVSGSGTTNYLAKWSGANGLGNSAVYDDGTNVGIGTASPPSYGAGYVAFAVNGSSFSVSDHFVGGTRRATWVTSTGGTNFGTVQNIPIVFQTGASQTERMRINDLGDVGIGSTSTVSARLQISGSATSSTSTVVIREGVANPTAGAAVLNVQNSAGTSILFVSGSSRVGVNTSTPAADFSIRGNFAAHSAFGTYTNMSWMGQFYYTPQQAGVGFSYPDGSGGSVIQGLSGTGNGNLSLNFYGGNVGIGGTNPTSRLEVTGSGATSSTSAANFVNSSGTSLLFVRNDGNIGVGTASPVRSLDVQNNTNYQFRVGLTSAFSYDIGRNTADGLLYFYGNQTGFTGYVFGGINGERVRIDSSGNVGIGTSSFTARLFVSGSTTSSTSTIVIREGVASATGGAEVLDVQNSAGTSLMYVSGSGEIGIGTISSMMTSTVTTTSTSATTLMSIPSATFRSAEFVVQGVDATGGKYHSVKIIAVHNGTTATHTEYGAVNVGGIAGTLNVTDPSGGTFLLQVTSASTNSTVWKVTAILTKA